MAITMSDVLAALGSEEPDYTAAVALGVEAMPLLHTVAQAAEPMLASKAVCLAGKIGGAEAEPVIAAGAEREEGVVQLAVAEARGRPALEETLVAASDLSALDLLRTLLNDKEPVVRRAALRVVPGGAEKSLLPLIREMARTDPDPHVQHLCLETIHRARTGDGRVKDEKLETVRAFHEPSVAPAAGALLPEESISGGTLPAALSAPLAKGKRLVETASGSTPAKPRTRKPS